jgi:asparagine synthase (glutamine-hydrolysing)
MPMQPHFQEVQRRLGFVPAWLQAWWRRSRKTRGALSPDFLTNIVEPDVCQAFLASIDIDGQLIGRPRLHQSMYLWTKLIFPAVMLGSLGDRSEMGHSIEGRLPMLDAELVEFVKRLPVSSKIHGTIAKNVLREAVRPFVPQRLSERRKHPFSAPPGIRGRARELVQDTLRSDAFRTLSFFDPNAVNHSLAETLRSEADEPTPDLQAAVCMTILQEHYHVAS